VERGGPTSRSLCEKWASGGHPAKADPLAAIRLAAFAAPSSAVLLPAFFLQGSSAWLAEAAQVWPPPEAVFAAAEEFADALPAG